MPYKSEHSFDPEDLPPIARINPAGKNMQLSAYPTAGYTNTETSPCNVPQDQATLFRLPIELILLIGEESNDCTVASLRLTCRFFNDILTPLFYKGLIKAFSLPANVQSGGRIFKLFLLAVKRDDIETLETLLQYGLKLDTRLRYYQSLLAFTLGEMRGPGAPGLPMKMLKLLIGKSEIDAMEFTAAVRSGFIEPVQMMIERVSPDTICEFITENKNILSDGIFRGGQSAACINLLLEHGALKSLNQPGDDGYTPLLKSLIFQEDANLAMILLEKGAVPYITVPFRTVTALHVAAGFLFGPIRRYENVVREPAGFTSLDVVKKILDSEYKDTLLDAVDRRGETPLMYAIRANKLETVKVLLQHKASPNIANADGLTPLKLAIDMANPTLVELLLEHGANVNHMNDKEILTLPLFNKL